MAALPGTRRHGIRHTEGLDVAVTDGTTAFVEHLRAAGFPEALHYDVITDPAPTGPWQLVFASAVLLHVPRELLSRVLGRLRDETVPGGHLIASLKTGRPEGWSSHKLDAPRWFTYCTAPDLDEVLQDSGWASRAMEEEGGRSDRWLVVHAQRPGRRRSGRHSEGTASETAEDSPSWGIP